MTRVTGQLFSDYTPSKYQAQIPTLATLAIDPSNPSSFPRSVFNPATATDEEKATMQQYYDAHPTRAPTLIFDKASPAEQQMGYKVPTRGHLPFFYNLASDEQDELYAAFNASLFDDILKAFPTPVLPTSPSALTAPTGAHNAAPVTPPVDFDIQACVDLINQQIPHQQRLAWANHPKEANFSLGMGLDEDRDEDEEAETASSDFDNHQHFLTTVYSPSASLHTQYLPRDPKLILAATQNLFEDPSVRRDPILRNLFLEPLTTTQQLDALFQQDNLNSYLTTNTQQHLLPSTPGAIPPTFTFPAEFIVNYIKSNAARAAVTLPRNPDLYMSLPTTSIASTTVSTQYQIASRYHPLAHNLLHHHTQMISSNNLRTQIEQHHSQILDQLRASLPPSEQHADEASDDMKQKQAQTAEEWAASPSTLELIRSAVMCEQITAMYPRK